jgi:hypothetical protein
MPASRLSRPAVLVMALFLLLVSALPALAATHVRGEKYEWTDEGKVWCTNYGFDFDLDVRSDITAQTTFVYDNNFELVETRTHYRGTDTVTNLTSGLVAKGPFAVHYISDFPTFIDTINGVEWMLRAPGRGIVFHSAGHLVLDFSESFPPEVVFEGGRHEYLGGDLALCYAMS